MVRWALLVAVVLIPALSGCIGNGPTEGPDPVGDETVIESSTLLELNGTGWARYEIRPAMESRIEVKLRAPSEVDLCEPFFSVRNLSPEEFTGLALYKDGQPGNASWYLLRARPWGTPVSSGAMHCARGVLNLDPGESAMLVLGTTMAGMAVDIEFGDEPSTAMPAALAPHRGFVMQRPTPERTATVDEGFVFVEMNERWATETEGGPRMVAAMAWHWEAIIYAELYSSRFRVKGVAEPVDYRSEPSPYLGAGGGASTSFMEGYASGSEPVVATYETVATGMAIGNRGAGLRVWEFPLEPPR